ncbi:MAG: TRAP transporter small permease [Candidatus Caldatribacteriota bacterium]|nr:TRAP transporter small permease [Candidatus Caldatribacteriota bacterium]
MEEKKLKMEELISAILLFIMASIAFINVLSRKVFHLSFAFTEEVTVHFFVWITVLGIAIAFEKGAHLGVVTVYNKLPKTLKKTAAFISAALSALLFLIVNYYAFREIYMDVTIFHMESEALRIPEWMYIVGIPIFSVFIFKNIYKGLKIELKKIEGEEGKQCKS